ncbi:AMP-binding acetyl-CoA synthetase [Alcanivorax sp. 97CO-5]|jgi:long-subunit acyl-CoA synthetase (AMP-forming)|uniref:AMP-binding protein n=1 Tax=Alcanivorax TaxID=59753 RepID=UPI0003E80117|nr:MULTISPECIES: AMP-binding protein [unclassified Alcanivorax]EUC67829.1 AMP-binding acetyl-CoA synthetase [Alcanivorax sp. 97CO-5]PKG00267.1 AMP-binding acetyl-CoA synthetase [Alcanivorax sp. 97CO-6]BAP13231.1 long-fatty-acid-CoA ligase [Alcanivorax sp. NBRC 101098]
MITDKSTITPLKALARLCSQQGDAVAFVQPLGGGELREYTWKQVDEEARKIAAYLQSIGMQKGDHVALVSKNCAEWIITDVAIWMAGGVSVPLYPTLVAETVRQILEHSESKFLFVGKLDDWDIMKAGVPDGVQQIALSLAPADVLKDFPKWPDIIRDTAPLLEVNAPALTDLATIVYTSGTTGMPKGVMHDFEGLSTVGEKMIKLYDLKPDGRMISYLPLSHVAERVAVEIAVLYVGNKIFFAESLDTFGEDIKRAQPTVFFAVPRIWSKFYQKASEALPPKKLNLLLKIPIVNKIIKKKILGAMGLDECRIALSGAAALSPEIIAWFKKLDLEILEGYGMTENLAWSHSTEEGDQQIGWVGTPNDGVECRIGDGGEILVRSVGNLKGYYKQPDKTAEDLTEDGWLHTGDVGEIDGKGRLRITGRVKEIFKTEKGKYVAPAPIENRLSTMPGLELACVIGQGMGQPVALLNLTPEEQERLSKDGEKERFNKELEKLLARVNEELDPHERLTTLIVCKDAWTVENNLITPTLKLKRNEIEKRYGDAIVRWSKTRGVVWEA